MRFFRGASARDLINSENRGYWRACERVGGYSCRRSKGREIDTRRVVAVLPQGSGPHQTAMRKLPFAFLLSLAMTGLAASNASAWFGSGCGGCNKGGCRPYNAFSPACCCCCRCCMPCCPAPAPQRAYPPPGGCGYPAPGCGSDAGYDPCPQVSGGGSCTTLPPVTGGPGTSYAMPPSSGPTYMPPVPPGAQPMPVGPPAATGAAYYPQVQPAGSMGYYGYPPRPMMYGYPPYGVR